MPIRQRLNRLLARHRDGEFILEREQNPEPLDLAFGVVNTPDREREISILGDWLSEANCIRDDVERPVLLFDFHRLHKGSYIFRIHRGIQTEIGVKEDLKRRPSFFTDNPDLLYSYLSSNPNDAQFLVVARAIHEVLLFDVATSEVQNVVMNGGIHEGRHIEPLRTLSADKRFISDQIGIQRWLSVEAAYLGAYGWETEGTAPAGIWDNHGSDIIIEEPFTFFDINISRI